MKVRVIVINCKKTMKTRVDKRRKQMLRKEGWKRFFQTSLKTFTQLHGE